MKLFWKLPDNILLPQLGKIVAIQPMLLLEQLVSLFREILQPVCTR